MLNGDDPRSRARLAELGDPRRDPDRFRRFTPSERGCPGGMVGPSILRVGGEDIRLRLSRDSRWEAAHHRENVLAALLAASAAGADPSKAARALELQGAAPSTQRAGPQASGAVEWINDSKATNPGAALAALTSQVAPLVWIAGGRDKGLTFEALARSGARNASGLRC